jgi:predicted NUDIX family phosphoesterase
VSDFLEAAYRALQATGVPLTAREITERSLAQGLLHSEGVTPWQTMKAKLATDILRKKHDSDFMRTEQGRFALRAWRDKYDEYVADRYQKALLDEDVMVFQATSLSKYLDGSGLHDSPLEGGDALIAECWPMERRDAEEDFSVIQLVSAFVIRFEDQILSYKRTRRLPEARLHGYYSLIFGGHLTPADIPGLWNIFDPEVGAIFLARELEEELRIPKTSSKRFEYRGVLYDDSRELSKQHLGIVFDVHLDSPDYEIGERGFLMQPRFETVDEIAARRQDFENWSVLLLDLELKGSATR